MFEKGAVQAWYESNGWTYPVQGPSSSGLGAIQQFFEALGLVQAPKVTISHDKIQFQGRPGGFLERMIHVQTAERRPVYAHATSNTPWLQVGRPILEGRTASIPIRVPSIPAMPGEHLKGTMQVTANGNQRFTVDVELTIGSSPSARQAASTMPVIDLADAMVAPPVIALPSAAPLELNAGREFRSSRPTPVPKPAEPIVVDTHDAVTPAASPFVALTPPAVDLPRWHPTTRLPPRCRCCRSSRRSCRFCFSACRCSSW